MARNPVTSTIVRALAGLLAVAGLGAAPASAQSLAAPDPALATAPVVAVPPLATPDNVKTEAGETASLANGMAQVIIADLKSTKSFVIADASKVRMPSYPEVTAPAYPLWSAAGAKILLSGFVEARSDNRLMVGCYVYDVQQQRELTRIGLLVPATEWRRGAHRCADAVYGKVTGNGPLFDSRVAYIAESGSVAAPVKRLAMMDFDGTNHTYLTAGDSTVLTPRWSPDAKRLAYAAFDGGEVHVEIVDVATKEDRPLLPGGTSFAPAFAPQGDQLAVSIATSGNTDIYLVGVDGSGLKRLTTSPAIDTGASFSPDGSTIVFASDRSGSQQLYKMGSDGSAQRRISFGAGEYGSPAWSPDGKHIAFTKIDGTAMRIGVMDSDGSNEHILTGGTTDESPSWGPSGDHIVFDRWYPGGHAALFTVSIDKGETRAVTTPQGGSDPAWVARDR